MAYIEGQAVLDGISRPGVRAHLYLRNEAGIRTGIRLSTEVTGQSTGGKDIQTIFSKGRFYFGNLTTGNYIVYLEGVGFNAEKKPVHRMPFDIVDDDPVPSTALLFSGGTLFLFGNQSSATTLSYIANLTGKSDDTIFTIGPSGDGVGDFTTYTNSSATPKILHRRLYTYHPSHTHLKFTAQTAVAGGGICYIKIEIFDIDGSPSIGSQTQVIISGHPTFAELTVSLGLVALGLTPGITYQVEASIVGDGANLAYVKGGICKGAKT